MTQLFSLNFFLLLNAQLNTVFGLSCTSAAAHKISYEMSSEKSRASGRLFLVPVDATEASQHSLDWVLDNIYRSGDEFYFLHVIAENHPSSSLMAGLDGLGGVDSALIVDASGESGKEQVEHAKAMLDQAYVQKAKAAGARQRIEVVQFSTDTESVGKVVTTRAEELKADMVVLVSHNRGKLSEFFVGSVSQYVIKNCPVVTVLLH